jgi:hypothetical protein
MNKISVINKTGKRIPKGTVVRVAAGSAKRVKRQYRENNMKGTIPHHFADGSGI